MASFDIRKIFTLDFWNPDKVRNSVGSIRPPAKISSVVTTYKQHNDGRGQDPRHEYYWTISFREQKILYLKDAWVKRCVDHLATNAGNLAWKIVPKPEYIYEYKNNQHMKAGAQLATQLLLRPSRSKETFSSLIRKIVRDLKIMDAAVLEKSRGTDGRLVELRCFDAATVKIDIDPFGNITGYYQELIGQDSLGLYNRKMAQPSYKENNIRHIAWQPSDIVYFKLCDRSESPYGSSPIASLVEAINADVATDINLYNFLMTGGINIGFMTIGKELDDDNVERIRDQFRRSLSPGRRYEFPIVSHGGADLDFKSMMQQNQEAQMAELQMELRNKILACLCVPPNELGLNGAGRGQVYSQQDVFWGNAMIPMMKTIAEYITDEVIAEFDDRLMLEFLPPKDYEFEAIIARISALDELGLIDEPTKYRMLNLEPPEEETYVSKKKRLEIEMMERNNRMQEMQEQIQRMNFKYLSAAPALEYQQQVAMAQQANVSSEEAALQKMQLQMQHEQLLFQKQQLEHEANVSDKEFQLRNIELQLQINQYLQEQAGAGQTQTPPNDQLVQAIAGGRVPINALAGMLQTGQVDEEQLKQINNAVRTVSSITKSIDIQRILKQMNNNPIMKKTEEILDPNKDFKEMSPEIDKSNFENTSDVLSNPLNKMKMFKLKMKGLDADSGKNYVPSINEDPIAQSPEAVEREMRDTAEGSKIR